MSDKDKLKDKAHLEDVISKMMGELGGSDIVTPGMKEPQNPMGYMQQVGEHLEQGMMELYENISQLGQMLDIARLHNFMLTKILVDKGVVTKEEIEQRYQTEVEEELKKQQEMMRKRMEEHLQQSIDKEVPDTKKD